MSDIRNLNTFTLGAGFNITSGEAIDSRQFVNTIDQIYSPDNWTKVKPYNGLLVVSADGEARICVDAANYQLEASWKKIGGDTTVVENLQASVTTIEQKLDTVQEGAQVNAIEEVKVDGVALSIVGKSVNIDLAGALSPYAKTEDVVSKSVYEARVTEVNNELAAKVAKSDFDALSAEVGAPAEGDSAATGIYKVIADVEAALKSDITAIPKFKIEVVNELPSTGDAATVYLVLDKESAGDLYTEYIYVNGAWENLGKQTVDLSAYSTTEEMNSAIESAVATAIAGVYSKSEVDGLLATKVDGTAFDAYKQEVTNELAAKVATSDFDTYKQEVTDALAGKVDNATLNDYQTTQAAEAAHTELSGRLDAVEDKASANEQAIANLKVKDVDNTPASGIAVELDSEGKIKASVNKSTLAADLVGTAGVVGDLSGANVKIGTAITATENVDGEDVTETIIDSTATVAEAVQVLAGQIQSAVAGGITGISGDEYIKVGGTTTSKSLTLEITKVVTAVANNLVSDDSAIQKDKNDHLQLVWSSL